MKARKILVFYAVVIAALAFLVLVYPSDGISIGKTTLRFPSMHQVLSSDENKSMEELLVKVPERDLTGARDSINNYRKLLFESQTRFWLPNDDITLFDSFFVHAEQACETGRVIRVLHYGDSQIEMDRISCRLRERLQEIFGGSGPGMLPLRQPIPTFSFSQSASGSLRGQSTYGDSTMRRAAGNYGPMLRSWRVSGGATMSLKATTNKFATERVGRFSRIRVLFNNRPGPMSVTIRDKDGGGSYSQSVSPEGIYVVEWKMDSVTSSASVTLQGTADVYGVMVDGDYGVSVDNISMRGVSGHQFKMVNLDQLTQAYSKMDVGVIIMQFGGNSVPYLKGDKVINRYCEQLGQQIDFVHQACPNATILFVGPSDMSTKVKGVMATYPDLPKVVERLRDTANAHGAAFWSIYDAMGGYNSMVTWVKNGYAGSDYIHFSHKGSNIMGDYFSDALLNLYGLYRIRKQLTKEQFDKLWQGE